VTIPVLIFAGYFLVVFAIGWFSMRATRDERDYWIAGGKLGWLVGGATLAATHVSAGTFIGTIGVMYTAGWSFGWVVLSIPLAYGFTAAVLAPRFTRVRELTLPAFLEARYGSRRLRGLSAVVILIATVVYIQAQIVAGGLVANIVFGIPREWGMITFTAILLAYTVTGGMIAVVYTDFLQLAVMIVGVLAAVPLAISRAGGWDALFTRVQAVNPQVFEWGGLPGSLLLTMGMAFFLGSVATPEKLTRLYAMKDMTTVRRALLLTILVVTGINLLVFLLALVAITLFPALPTGDLAMPLLTRAVLPPVLGTLVLAAITSAMMSTVDSLLIVAGSALAFDLYGTLVDPGATARRRMWVNRLGVLLVGTAPVVLLLSGVGQGQLVQFIVLLFTALMGASFFVPVVLGVYWSRGTKEGAAAAMIGGVTTTFLWKALGIGAIDPVLPGFLASAALYVTVSLVSPAPPPDALSPYRGEG
jgi:SSS family transporter